MRSETEQFGLQRLVTGNRCEVQGCYEVALWLLRNKDATKHLCAKHTRSSMRSMSITRDKMSLRELA